MKKVFKCIAGLPVGAIAAMMGAATLSNAWFGAGFVWIRTITMFCGVLVWLGGLVKIAGHFKVFKEEYTKVIPASLYAAFTMLLMILSAWLHQWTPKPAQALFFTGLFLHSIHIALFAFRNVFRGGVAAETFTPSWFVTFNGVMVSLVVGPDFLPQEVKTALLYYGLGVYFLLIICLTARLKLKPLAPALLHTKAVVLAPVSLCLVSYLNVEPNPLPALILLLYGGLLLSLLYVLLTIPRFFGVPFNPGFAGLTFPMAIGTVGSFRLSSWLQNAGLEIWSKAVRELGGVQLYITTAIIAFVGFNFLRLGAARLARGS
jgi:exfoliative toxin A/B